MCHHCCAHAPFHLASWRHHCGTVGYDHHSPWNQSSWIGRVVMNHMGDTAHNDIIHQISVTLWHCVWANLGTVWMLPNDSRRQHFLVMSVMGIDRAQRCTGMCPGGRGLWDPWAESTIPSDSLNVSAASEPGNNDQWRLAWSQCGSFQRNHPVDRNHHLVWSLAQEDLIEAINRSSRTPPTQAFVSLGVTMNQAEAELLVYSLSSVDLLADHSPCKRYRNNDDIISW